MTDESTVQLHFSGPFSFGGGERSLFRCSSKNSACVYLWTIKSDLDHRFYIHYVGETTSLAKRQREHLIHMLGLNYGIFDPVAARRGELSLLWPGLWRDRTDEGPDRLLEAHARISGLVSDYVAALDVFVAPIDVDRSVRRHVEGAIAMNLRLNQKHECSLYPSDNHVGVGRTKRSLRILISSDAPIAGLADTLDI